MRVSSVGREMFRGSRDMLTTQTSGNSTVKLMKMRIACSMSCLPQPARKNARRRLGMVSAMAGLDIGLGRLRDAVREQREHQQDDHRVDPECCGHAIEPLLVHETECRGHEYLGLPERPTPGAPVDQVEEVERPDQPVH